MNGFELLEEAKSDSAISSIPIVVLSGSDAPDDIKRSYELGANGYLVKPDPGRLTLLAQTIEAHWFTLGRIP